MTPVLKPVLTPFPLPLHLQKYVVDQDYDRYTPIDQAVWRYILRQLRGFLAEHGHESYLDGLKKTGIEVERIPRISVISEKLQEFGWRAIPVSGFIPPAAFMELQSLGILPIASDMRSIEHLKYTPAPDIVHEAAGHAPILIHPEFAKYLRQYAEVAKKAIISNDDLAIYEAIRVLSDLKENPQSTPDAIDKAEKHLLEMTKQLSDCSEASELSRMNWWTAEYGLIGSLDAPKIFGAGLLSSVGESKWCLSDQVKKIPLSIDCVNVPYDITEPQPQLFVARDFAHLSEVLEQQASRMAFRHGGISGLDKIIRARSVNTVQLDSGIQISGKLKSYLRMPSQGQIEPIEQMDQIKQIEQRSEDIPFYLQFEGPVQLSYAECEIPGHSRKYHAQGFGSPIGLIQGEARPIASWTSEDWARYGVFWSDFLTEKKLTQSASAMAAPLRLQFSSGVVVQGNLASRVLRQNKTILLTFTQCRVDYKAQVLFDPSWGDFDMAIGSTVPSVFGGPADRDAFGEMSDFQSVRVPKIEFTQTQRAVHELYQKVGSMREDAAKTPPSLPDLESLECEITEKAPHQDWLIRLELLELSLHYFPRSPIVSRLEKHLRNCAHENIELREVILDGLSLLDRRGSLNRRGFLNRRGRANQL